MLVRSAYDITNDRLFSPGLPLLWTRTLDALGIPIPFHTYRTVIFLWFFAL